MTLKQFSSRVRPLATSCPLVDTEEGAVSWVVPLHSEVYA